MVDHETKQFFPVGWTKKIRKGWVAILFYLSMCPAVFPVELNDLLPHMGYAELEQDHSEVTAGHVQLAVGSVI